MTNRLYLVLIITFPMACASTAPLPQNLHSDAQAAFDYLQDLQGDWEILGGNEGPFGWSFDTTSKGGVILERLKLGTPTEMATVYHLENGMLVGSHFCQLGNQPRVLAVHSELEGDLHFECDGNVGTADSHDELHMHGVHFQKSGDKLHIWMDMFKDGGTAFQTSYQLRRTGN